MRINKKTVTVTVKAWRKTGDRYLVSEPYTPVFCLETLKECFCFNSKGFVGWISASREMPEDGECVRVFVRRNRHRVVGWSWGWERDDTGFGMYTKAGELLNELIPRTTEGPVKVFVWLEEEHDDG